MIRLTKRMPDGTYQANVDPDLPGENSYAYKEMIIHRCGILEDVYENAIKSLEKAMELNAILTFSKGE